MHINYNGIDIECLEILESVFESVYDETGTDYLYSRYHLAVTGVINGQSEIQQYTPTTNYAEGGSQNLSQYQYWRNHAPAGAAPPFDDPPPNVNPYFGGGARPQRSSKATPGAGITAISPTQFPVPDIIRRPVPAITTDAVIRSRLQTPRGRLFVFTGSGDTSRKDEVLLQSHPWNSHTDCKNGPFPKLYAVTQFSGDAQTFMVRFEVETFINETPASAAVANLQKVGVMEGAYSVGGGINSSLANRALLSNRFSMRHSLDDDNYLTILTQGVAHFRTDLLYTNEPLNPDDLRLNLMLPVPFGCVRGDIEIEGLPDGTGVTYSFVDREQRANFVGGPYCFATQIEAVHRQAVSIDDDFLTGALNVYERQLNLKVQREFARDREKERAAATAKSQKRVPRKRLTRDSKE
ncbi:unnamed protein product [Gemmata massiliana]|uniref:Uncharacterized protein n=1 Tax=Gemmata massiliana TaxID=1210884 RepID=A0A6P2CY80_9BACT|nr:hypothetical protein [Gemmata massiliana]VTR92150.1 unnamed protein product [Gemmata massiliana]